MKKSEGKKLTPPVLIALTVVGVLVFGLAVWFALVRPQGGKIKQVKADQAEIQQQIDDIRAKTASARQAPKIHYADVYRLAKAMPDDTDMPDLVLELGQLARDTGIEFDSISPAPPASLGAYTVVPITVKFNGNFFNLADFLYRLRTLVDVHNSRLDATGRLFSVDTLTFSEAPQRFPMIQASLLIDAFVYGNAVPSGTPGAAPTDTTSTDTTSTDTTSTDTTSTSTTSTDTTSTTTTTSTEPTASASAAGAP
jgi:Tfp pilus assembly protein PilO